MILIQPEQRWVCPNCSETAVTTGQPNRFHPCPGLAGVVAPLVLEGVRCRVTAELRQDYVGHEDVTYDAGGRPVMAVRTVRDDGEDVAVFAPTAHMRGGSHGLGR